MTIDQLAFISVARIQSHSCPEKKIRTDVQQCYHPQFHYEATITSFGDTAEWAGLTLAKAEAVGTLFSFK